MAQTEHGAFREGCEGTESDTQNPDDSGKMKNGTDIVPMKGLPSSGMSCYFNCVLQVLAQTPGLTHALLECDGMRGPVRTALLEILLEINCEESAYGDVVPEHYM
ncbi:hypothetical protein ScPMuIL_013134 [Solemya velum]